MTKNYFWLFFLYCILQLNTVRSQTNIGFENGTTSGWTISGSGAKTIMSGGNDPYFSSIPCVYPGGGNYSLRIGDISGSSGYGATLKQTFTVSTSNASFIYHYAVVLEDGSHNSSDQPYFQIRMYDKNNNEINCATYDVNSNTASTVGFSKSGSYSYKDWTSVLVPLDAYIGQQVTIEFVVDWCVYNVHLGYAYVDCEVAALDLLSSSPIVCGGQAITLTAPAGAQKYSWTGPNGFTDNTQIVSVTDPGTYYCTILSKNTSGAYCTSTLDITISGNPSNPVASFTSTNTCLGTASQFIDKSTISGSTITSWLWDFGDGSTSTQKNPTHTYASSGNFTVSLTVTTAEGCDATITQTVKVSKAPTLSTSVTNENCGLKDGTASVNATGGSGSYTYSWSSTPVQTTATASGLASGSYTVTVDDGNCSATAIATVTSKAGPTLTMSSTDEYCGAKDGTASVKASGGTGSYTYSWNSSPVQTTSTATGLNSGSYTVTVDDGTCSATGTVSVNAAAAPTLSFTTTKENCGASDGTATVTASGGTGTFTYSWNTSPIQTTKTATALASGTYTVTVDDGNCTVTGNTTITSNNSPSLTVSSTNTTCSNPNGTATVSVSGGTGTYSYSWNTSPLQTTATASSLNPGTYTVTVDDGICPVSSTVSVIADPYAVVPQSDFGFNYVCLNEATVFSDLSNTYGTTTTTWQWDFGDGNSSSLQSPYHSYTTAGTFNVTLTITNQYNCSSTLTQPTTVHPLPQTNFSVNPVCLNQFSILTDATTIASGNINSWAWDLGDGSLSANQSPSHAYSQPGTYTITLITTSDNGCKDTLSKNTTVNPLPVAEFNSLSVCQNEATPFTDLSSISSGSIVSWNWSLGDGNSSALQSPSHTYASPGNYSVTLMATSDQGCTASMIHTASVNTNPSSNFSVNNVCQYDEAIFTNTSTIGTGSISGYEWDFGDGITSTLSSPNHQYAQAGTYTVSLIAISGSSCSDTLLQSVTIYAVPQAALTTSNVCDKQQASFTDASNANSTLITSWQWDFGNAGTSTEQNPALSFPSSGSYATQLVVITNDGCSDTANGSIQIYPLPIVDYTTNNVCLNAPSTFSNLTYLSSGNVSSWQWDYGNGNSSTSQSPTYTYPADGVYNVTLVATTDMGCIDSITQVLTIYPLPVVDFIADKYNGCVDLDINFTNNSTISSTTIKSYYWDFGDGATSTASNPSYTYTVAGTYTVSLVATSDKGCVDQNDYPTTIEAYALPVAGFSASPDYISILKPKVEFSNSSSADAISWNWYFGDEVVSDLENPSHTYADTGNYQVWLTVSNQYGCVDSISDIIRVNPDAILYIPNAFSPNGNGTNDYFTPKGLGILEYRMDIFDRWGYKIFTTNDMNIGWDGTKSGGPAQEDVYVYHIVVKNVLDEKNTYVGRVSLIR